MKRLKCADCNSSCGEEQPHPIDRVIRQPIRDGVCLAAVDVSCEAARLQGCETAAGDVMGGDNAQVQTLG
jgi:hypothetical protein